MIWYRTPNMQMIDLEKCTSFYRVAPDQIFFCFDTENCDRVVYKDAMEADETFDILCKRLHFLEEKE